MARRSVQSTVVRIILLFLLVSLLVLCVYAVVRTFFARDVLDTFRVRYGLLRGIDLFLEHLIAIQAAAVILTYSLFSKTAVPASELGSRKPFHRIAVPTVVMLIVLTGVYTILYLTVLPLVKTGIQELRVLSSSARTFLVWAEEEEERGRREAAARYLELYLTIDRENRAVIRNRDRLERLIAEAQSSDRPEQAGTVDGGSETGEAPAAEGYTLAELLDLAEGYLESEDFFSAYYYATLALRLDEQNTQARMLKQNAWKELTGYELSKTEDEQARLFERKLTGSQALEEGNIVEAYYIFKELSSEYSSDPEVERLMEESLRRVRQISFFLDEVRPSRALPGVTDITFLNSEGRADGNPEAPEPQTTELVHLEKMVSSRGGDVYFYGIEIIRMSADGVVDFHFRAPYGKLIEDHINMQCLVRDDRQTRYLPRIIEGSLGEMGPMIALRQDARSLPFYSSDTRSLSRMGINGLWLIREPFERAGYTRATVENALLLRLLRPFLFLVISLLSVSVGWTYRIRSLGRPPIATFLMVPALPFLTAPVVMLLVYGHRIVLGSVLLLAGFPLALTALIVAEAVLLVVSLALLAGQATD